MSKAKKVQLPGCLSGYEEGDETCDGDPNGVDEYEQAPCAWIERCVVFQGYLAENEDKSADDFMNVVEDDDGNEIGESSQAFVDRLDAMVERQSEQDEVEEVEDAGEQDEVEEVEDAGELVVSAPSTPGTKGAKKTKKKKGKHSSAASRRKQAIMDEMLPHFVKHVKEQFNERTFNDDKTAPMPGQFYVIDRMSTSGLINVYCKTVSGRDKPLATLIPKSRSGNIDVLMPVEKFKGIGKEVANKICAKVWSDGTKTLLKTISREADKERLALIAFALKKAHDKGQLELPDTQ